MKKQLTEIEQQNVINKLESYLKDLKIRWDQENQNVKNWIFLDQKTLFNFAQFILNVIDELIIFVEQNIPDGTDKKAAVLSVVGKLFDYIAIQAFPFWLKPFTSFIKQIVVNITISELIDYIVSKYNSGYWSLQQEAANGQANKNA
jgi:hypothetical protein